MANVGTSVRMADVGAQLTRQWKTVAAVLAATVIAAAVLGIAVPRHYSATAVLTVSPIPTSPLDTSGGNDKVNMTTERAVIKSTEVAQRAKRLLHSPARPADLAGHLRIASPQDSQVLQATASAGSREQAARIANAFAHGYLDTRAARAKAILDKGSAGLAKRISDLRARVAQASPKASTSSLSRELHDLESQQSAVATTVVDPGRVVTEADPAGAVASLGLFAYLAGGLVIGVLLSIAAGLLRERFTPEVSGSARLTALTGVPAVEQGRSDHPAAFLDRLAVRAGVGVTAPAMTVAVLGVEPADVTALGRALRDRLSHAGFRPALVPHGADAPPAALAAGACRSAGADVAIATIRVADGLTRSVLLARGADRLVLAVTRGTRVSRVTELLAELAPTVVDVVAVVPPAAPASGAPQHAANPAPTANHDAETTRFTPVDG
jgi:hypothetical protein